MDNRRTDTAREHDDSDIIDRVEPAPSQGGSSGGNLQEDVATQAELERVRPLTRLIEKPYSLVMLVETLEEMLSARGSQNLHS